MFLTPRSCIKLKAKRFDPGFSMIEALVAIGLFVIIVIPLYLAYSNILVAMTKDQARQSATALIQNQFEISRNMPYSSIGIAGGYPPGALVANQNVSYQGNNFNLITTVRNIDDPYDGIAGGNPNDTAPADYKLVEITATCTSCQNFVPLTMTTTVAPKSLETTTNNGSLFINVFDANGLAVPQANVHVHNIAFNPAITIDDITNNSGVLQLVDIPTSTSAYQVSVSKSGYSSEETYPMAAPSNPNPIKPHATVASQQVTQISFSIDKTSSLTLNTTDEFCESIPNINFNINSTKLIGTSPNVLKFSASTATGASGQKTFNTLEWDAYSFNITNANYDLSGVNQSLPLIINPGSNYQMNWRLSPKNPSALLISVSNGSGEAIDNAKVILSKTGFSQTFYTKRRDAKETNWAQNNYSSQSGNIDTESVPGTFTLQSALGKYPTSTEWLISKTIDFGTQDISFYDLNWNPEIQPISTGPESVKFQIATNNDNSTWNFIGPAGTSDSYYTLNSSQINSNHNNNRYLRYKVFMKTDNENFTPNLNDLTINFSSSCTISGQAFINDLSNGTYNLTIEKSGYQIFIDPALIISDSWQEYKATLLP